MKITVLDAATLGADLDLSRLAALGELTVYDTTALAEVRDRLADTDVAVINKIRINAENLAENDRLKLVAVCATGYDNVDLAVCRERGVAVTNVVGYSTNSVAQLTLAMVLSLSTNLKAFRRTVDSGAYTAGGVANCLTPVYHELCGKTWGVVGFGNIGAQVAKVAEAMGCRVLAFAKSPKTGVENATLERLCRESDIISVHLPLTPETRGIIGASEIALMKPDAILINVARGAVTDEQALTDAILSGRLGGLGVDVYSAEPLPAEHPFTTLRGLDNVCLTPHMAWGAYEARARCLAEVAENIAAFVSGERRCRVD
ncbi:MAG: hydroxyacid dehydrogenase [Clostridia bacterium]|nr:hydroxyacid dehydrogenase [Clostridia bacterium]